MIFLLIFFYSTSQASDARYRVCLPTPPGCGDILVGRHAFFMKNQWFLMKCVHFWRDYGQKMSPDCNIDVNTCRLSLEKLNTWILLWLFLLSPATKSLLPKIILKNPIFWNFLVFVYFFKKKSILMGLGASGTKTMLKKPKNCENPLKNRKNNKKHIFSNNFRQ